MPKHSKRVSENLKKTSRTESYKPEEAVALAKQYANAKFDESLELHLKLGADPAKGDQTVRGTTTLPHGTGKQPKVAVFAEGDAAREAEEALSLIHI